VHAESADGGADISFDAPVDPSVIEYVATSSPDGITARARSRSSP